MRVYVAGIGLLAPGLAGWDAARAVLNGEAPYERREMPRPTADVLPPAERRRCGETVKLALHVGAEALAGSPVRAETLPTVFTSASGNGDVLHQICETLAGTERNVSPTRFHNSVHNAPAGYWSIATGSRESSTSLCAHVGSFAAGLLEAALVATSERRAVLLVAYDTPHPEPLASVDPVTAPFAVALLLSGETIAAPGAALELALVRDAEETSLRNPELEALRRGNSAARSLPLLAAIAAGRAARTVLEYVPQQSLAVAVTPGIDGDARKLT